MARPRSFSTRSASREYLAQVFGGIPMSQGEIVRLTDFGLSGQQIAARRPACGRSPDRHRQYAAPTAPASPSSSTITRRAETIGATGLDETLEAIRSEMRKFAADNVTPYRA